MASIPHDFQDWRYRLRDIQELESSPTYTGCTSKLHAKVLRYFISRYDYQPLPAMRSARQGPAIPLSMTARTTIVEPADPSGAVARGSEDCRRVLAEIHAANSFRKRYEC